MKKCLCSFIALIFLLNLCRAQGIVNVNPLTGTANVAIPIKSISAGAVSVPIQLVYNATGIKPKDVEGTAGMGWQLAVGGQVSRQVRGLPDDVKKDNAGNPMAGWIYNSNQGLINSFSIANNGSNCSYETTDLNYISSNFGNLSDTEPDMFYVNGPGLSCQLVYDQSASKFRTIPYQDLSISYTTNGTSGLITSFTIRNNQGITYVFSSPETVTQTTDLVGNGSGVVNYFQNAYSQYYYGVNYDDSWNLTSITDITGQGIALNYTAASARSSTNPVNLYLGGSTTASLQYNNRMTTTPQTLNELQIVDADNIVTNNLYFTWETNNGPINTKGTGQTMISTITGLGDTVTFVYNPVIYSGDATQYNRFFLRSFSGKGCGTPLNYTFSYSGQSYSSNTYYTILSDSSSKKFDYWGYNSTTSFAIPEVYVNPSTSGYQRYVVAAATSPGAVYPYTIGTTYSRPDTVNVMAGTLDTIFYAMGGQTTMTYQSNDYLDPASNTIVKGGGIRIKQIIDYDGMNSGNNMTRHYSYANPVTGAASSGKPVSLPAYAFTIPYTGGGSGQTLWNNSTAISDQDLSTEDHTIMYGNVTMSMAGAGKTVYQYYIPATNWDASAVPACSGCTTADWAPTENYVGRTNCSNNYGQVKNDTYSYPFVFNTNYDFERGLLQKVINYNNATPAVEVSESDYTYQRSYGTATAIPALQFEYNQGYGGVLAYSKYTVYTTTSELAYTVVNKVFDSPTLSKYQQSLVTYTYGSPNHKLLTQQSTTNSDNSVLIKNMNYVKDFTAAAGSNPNVTAIYNLQQENINVPVETWTQVQRSGTNYTTNGALTLFSVAANTGNPTPMYLPSQQFSFFSAEGDSGFTPFTISGQTTTKYSGYPALPSANYTHYDYTGSLQTMDDGHHHEKSSIKNYYPQKPSITVTNAASNEFVYSSFDGYNVSPFMNMALSGIPTYVPGHTGEGATFLTSQTLTSSAAITKTAGANRYVFSIWINSGTSSGTISIVLTPTGGSAHTYTESFAAINGWQYYEWKLPVTAVTSTFTLSATTSATISIDDIIVYPENSEVTTYSFDLVTLFPTAVTNTNGITTYYTYDRWGRLMYVYDRYRNILKKDSYILPNSAAEYDNSTLTASVGAGHFDTNTAVNLYTSAPIYCYSSETTYIWDFGDGSNKVTTATDVAPAHTYIDSGWYTPKVTISSPVYGQYIASTSIHIVPGPMNLSYNNNTTAHGVVYNMNFYQNGVLIYNVTPANISGMHPLKGSYNIVVTFVSNAYQYVPATGQGYSSITLTPSTGYSSCSNYSSSNSYSFGMDLTHSLSLTFSVQTAVCSGGGGGGPQ